MTLATTAQVSSFDIGPAFDSVAKAGPVAVVLLLFIWFLIRQLDKKDLELKAKDDTIAKKDEKIEKLTTALGTLSEKQTEANVLVRDRLRRMEYALGLKRDLADTSGKGETG